MIAVDGKMVNCCHENLSCEKYYSQTFIIFFVAHESVLVVGAQTEPSLLFRDLEGYNLILKCFITFQQYIFLLKC